jgi:hypothetical protein
MVTVCIFMLRDATRTVQKAYNIPMYGTKHGIPAMEREVAELAKALQSNNVQEYVPKRATRNVPVRDLFGVGAEYPDARGAFSKFRKSLYQPVNVGITNPLILPEEYVEEYPEGFHEEYEPDEEDLDDDDEEPYTMAGTIIRAAVNMADEWEMDSL